MGRSPRVARQRRRVHRRTHQLGARISRKNAPILVVDDDPGARGTLADALTFLGHEVVQAQDGVTALAIVAERPLHAVCLDLWMDGLHGVEVLERLLRDRPELPVIIVTGDPLTDTMQEAIARGAAAYLCKPFELGELSAVVTAVIGPR